MVKSVLISSALCLSMGRAQNLVQGNVGVHDPVMIKEGSTYYVFYTGALVQARTSSNMATWSGAGGTLPTPVPAWWSQLVPNRESGNRLWAPDISYRNGTYWLYYSMSSFGSQTSAIGLATRASLSSGSWQDQGVVINSPSASGNFNAIDPNAITDVQGNVWLNWGSWWDGIFIVQLNPTTGKPLATSSPTLIAGRGGSGIEGSFIIYARGYYHLFTSWDRCCAGTSSTYNMRYGRSTSVTGPYVDKTGRSLATGGGTLLSDGTGSPGGHNGIFQENGNHYIVYHLYTASGSNLQIRRLYFDAQTWPTLDSTQAVAIRPLHRFPAGMSITPLYDLTGRQWSEPADAARRIPLELVRIKDK